MTSEGHHEATERPLRCPLRCLWQEGNLVLWCSQRDEVGKTRDTRTRERAPDRLSWGEAGSARWLKGQTSMPSGGGRSVSGVPVRPRTRCAGHKDPRPLPGDGHAQRDPLGTPSSGGPPASGPCTAARSRRGRGLLPNARPAPGGLSRRAPRTQAGPGKGKRYFTMKRKIKELLEILKHNYENRIP